MKFENKGKRGKVTKKLSKNKIKCINKSRIE
jgi:hypothetical protein